MKKNEIVELLKKGFNTEKMAETLNCSVGRINELKCEPVEGQVYHKADINAEAILAFAEKHKIDIEAIDFEAIVAARKQPKVEKCALKVGDITKYGVIQAINKIGNSFAYLIMQDDGTYTMKSTKDLAD